MTVNLGGRHVAAPAHVVLRGALAGALIVLIAAVAGAVGGLITEVF